MNTLKKITSLYKELQPLNRSLLGNANKKTLEIINEIIPLNLNTVYSGEKVYDWIIPKKWTINSAWIKDENGNILIDIKDSILNVVQYSCSVNTTMTYEELTSKLHFDPNLPNAIPYKTSYYNEDWGFCISYNFFKKNFKKGKVYYINIDSSFSDSELIIGEYNIKGESNKTILFSTYICHPIMVNDNLSGIVLNTLLAKSLSLKKTKYSYKFLFLPETIGSIAWICKNNTQNIIGGCAISCVGGPGSFSYKRTFKKTHFLDYIIEGIFKDNGLKNNFENFTPQGSDERQFSSPGVRIPMAGIYKDKYHNYKFYHTSLDNLKVCKPKYVLETLELYQSLISKIELLIFPKKHILECETKLDKYNLYPKLGRTTKKSDKSELSKIDIILWVLFYSDGVNSNLEISEKTQIDLSQINNIIYELKENNIIDF